MDVRLDAFRMTACNSNYIGLQPICQIESSYKMIINSYDHGHLYKQRQ